MYGLKVIAILRSQNGRRACLFRFLPVFFFLILTGQAQSASVWLSGGEVLYRLDSETNQLILNITTDDLGKIQALAATSDADVWVIGDKRLLKVAATGETLLALDAKKIGLESAQYALLNPYDQSLWLVGSNSLQHLDANGVLTSRVALPAPSRAASLGLDEYLWVLGNKQLWRYSPQERLVAEYDLPVSLKEESKYLAIDSVGNRLWIAGERKLVQLDSNDPNLLLKTIQLPLPVTALSLDGRNGNVWVLMEDLLLVYQRDGALLANINLKALPIEKVQTMAFDVLSQSLWLGNKDGLARFSSNGEVEAMFSSEAPVEKLGVTPFVVTPKLTLIRPSNDAFINENQPGITLEVAAYCYDNPCGFSADHASSYVLNVLLNNNQIGNKFKYKPDVGQFMVSPETPLDEGPQNITAQATDWFGHKSNKVSASFTVDTVPPRFLNISPPDGSVLAEPQVIVSGAVDDKDVWVLLNGVINPENENTANFKFPVLLTPGLNTLNLSAYDKASNSSSIDLQLSFVPDLSVSVSIDKPSAGANVEGDSVVVSGSFIGPSNTGVTVNGIVASQNEDRFYATVPLVTGQNTLTAVATKPDGVLVTQSITVNSSGASPISVSVEPDGGIAPLKVTFAVQNNTENALSKIQIDFDGNGTVDFTSEDPGARIENTYDTPGVYQATVTVTDSLSNVYTKSQMVTVQDIAKMDAMLRGVYMGMLSWLRQGNIDAALAFVTGGVHEKYKVVFYALKPTLATIVDQLGGIQDGSISGGMAEYVIVRNTAFGPQAFLIYFILGEDGVWRIDGL